MFDFFPRLAVAKPVLTTMLLALCLVLGAYSLLGLRMALFPDVEFPVVSIATSYPGAGPQEIETQVTDPIEEAISALPNVDEIRSFSQENLSLVIVQFDIGVHQDQVAIDVRDRIEAIRGALSGAVEPPVVQKFEIGAIPIMNLALAGPQDVDVLYELADFDLRERFSRVDGVAETQIVGGREREVEVLVDPERLLAYGVTLAEIVNMIRSENVSIPAGRITEEDAVVPVRVIGEYASVEELEDLRLLLPDNRTVRLGEVATIRDGFEDLRQAAGGPL